MTSFFYKTILLTVFSLHGLLVFPQTKIIIYNGNTAQKEYKVFTASLINSFANPELECKAEDETKNINALLKQQGYKNNSVPDTVLATVCEKFEADYLINFTLYPQKTANNVRISLINAKTLSVEKTKVLTCNDLKNKNQVKITTDEIAVKFLREEQKEENDTNVVELETEVFKPKRIKDGHYLTVGSSLFSSGYYGLFGIAYEYRHRVFGFNASAGLGYSSLVGNDGFYEDFFVNVGCKFYLANKIPVLRNLYFNLMPFSYFGQELVDRQAFSERGDNYNVITTVESKYSHVFGAKILFGLCPVWKVSEKVSLGLNISMGYNVCYNSMKYDYFYYYMKHRDASRFPPPYMEEKPFSWDLGLIIKIK